MKQLTITFFFSIISIFCFAQTPFTEETFRAINQRLLEDFSKVLNEETSPDYTFINGIGGINNLEQMKKVFASGNKINSWDLSDIKIKQIGAVALVTGTNKHSIYHANANTIRHYNERFIYTYEYKNNKWLFLTAQHSEIMPIAKEEESVIKKALIEERMALFMGDREALKRLWKDDPKIFHTASYSNGTYHYGDNEGIKKSIATATANPLGKIPEVTNARINIKGKIAIVDFDQVNTNRDGRKGYEHNITIMEKVGDDWKCIGHSGHGVMQKDDNGEEALRMFISEYNKDATAFFMDRCSDDFRYTNVDGKFSGKEQLKSNTTRTSNSEISDLKVIQNGFLAVINGIHIWKDDSNKVTRKVAFTYTLQKISNKWMFVASQQTPVKE